MNLEAIDLVVLGSYFLAVLGVGLWFGRHEHDTNDFFLGGRRQPWLVVGLSIIATEVSALTFLIVPGRSYADDFWYLQLYAGSIVGRLLIVYLLLPAFYRAKVTTVYEYLGLRFGPLTRTTAAILFFVSRIIGSSVRLLAASIAIAIIFDWPVAPVVFGVAGMVVVYTTFGGIKSIIWTDALQAIVFLGGGVATVIFLFSALPGDWSDQLATLHKAEKLRVFHWGTDFNNDKLFWVLAIHSLFQTMAALGTDQDLTQRMLTCPDVRSSQRSLLFNAIAGLPIVCLFLLIGSLLFAYYQMQPIVPSAQGDGAMDRIFAHFISTAIPAGWGLKGLLVACVFAAAMSSLDSALGAMSSSAITDLYRPLIRPAATEQECLLAARLVTIAFGALLAGVAVCFIGHTDLLEAAFGWASLIFGGLLGIFLLGVTTRRQGHDRANVFAMLSSVGLLVCLKAYQDANHVIFVTWPWWVVLGTTWTFIVGCIFRPNNERSAAARP